MQILQRTFRSNGIRVFPYRMVLGNGLKFGRPCFYEIALKVVENCIVGYGVYHYFNNKKIR
jgi:hypothetical protein